MIKWIVRAAIAPVTEIVALFFKAQTDKTRLREKSKQIAIDADARFREAKIGYWMGRVPLFIAEFSASCYFSAILWDSYVATHGWFSPLELPKWFQPQFALAMASIFGLALAQRYLAKPK